VERIRQGRCWSAKPCCDWWTASVYALTVSAWS